MKNWRCVVVALSFLAGLCVAVQGAVIPSGTPLAVRVPNHLPLHIGQVVDAELVYPVYVDNQLVLPTATRVRGEVTALKPDDAHRLQARLRGDFTPFSTPVIQFDSLVLQDGTTIPLQTGVAMDGAPLYSLVPAPPHKGGFIRQQFDMVVAMAKDRIAIVTAPEKKDRLVQFLYTQIPYHPQRIEKGTAWTVETTEPVTVGEHDLRNSTAIQPPADLEPTQPWTIRAFLKEPLNSKTAKNAEPVHAVVAEPIFNSDHTIAVPEGAILVGAVTQARPARWLGRAGVLRFDFRQLVLPEGSVKNVQTSLTGVDSAGRNMAMDSEGKVKPKPQDKLLVPLILFALASRPLDQDHGQGSSFGQNAVASNSIGLVGFIIGTTSRAPNVAAGIGYYGFALSFYNRWIKKGEEINFAHNTRVILQTTARRSTVLHPQM